MCVNGVWGNGVTFPQRFFASFLASKKGRYFSLCTPPSLCGDRKFRVPQTGLSFIMELPRPLYLLCATYQGRKKVANLLPIRIREMITARIPVKTILPGTFSFSRKTNHPSTFPLRILKCNSCSAFAGGRILSFPVVEDAVVAAVNHFIVPLHV